MLKQLITYNDYNGVPHTEDFYFNINESEILEMAIGDKRDLGDLLRNISEATTPGELLSLFKDLIKLSYGKKSSDGKRFVKSDEIFEEFYQSEAYSALLSSFVFDARKALDFINAVLPADFLARVADFSNDSSDDSKFSVVKE